MISRIINGEIYSKAGPHILKSRPETMGSFDSIENANTLVNDVVKLYRNDLQNALATPYKIYKIDHRFGSRTGEEICSQSASDKPYFRTIYAIRVVFTRDKWWNDWRIRSAFPTNYKSAK